MTDEPRDPWLREALRHAPDPQTPPATLRDAILREARRPLASAAAVPWWSRLGAWLTRPPVAAGFASVMVMTAAGLLWWDEPVPPMDRPAPASAEVEVAAAPPLPAASLMRKAPDEREAAVAPKPAPAREGTAQPRHETRPAPVPPAAADSAAATGSTAPVPSQPPGGALAKQSVEAPASAQAKTPLGTVRDTIAADPGRWTWQRGTGPIQPMNAALLDWIGKLDASTTSPWTASQGQSGGTPLLQLRRDGRVVHRWAFSVDGVTWFEDSTARQAQLPEPAVRRLLEVLDRLQ